MRSCICGVGLKLSTAAMPSLLMDNSYMTAIARAGYSTPHTKVVASTGIIPHEDKS